MMHQSGINPRTYTWTLNDVKILNPLIVVNKDGFGMDVTL